MPIDVKRLTAGAIALAVFLFWLYAALLPWRAERLAQRVADGEVPLDAVPSLPGADAAPRIALERMLLRGPLDPERANDYFERSLQARPLYAPTWLLGAELALRVGDSETAAARAATAARLWPTRPELQWRVAMFQVRAGDTDAALTALRAYLSAEPKGAIRAAAVARRLTPDRGALVAALLPPHDSGARGTVLKLLARFAQQTRDVALADALWSAAPEAQSEPVMVFPYIDLMIAAGERERALRAWSAMRGEMVAPGHLSNGGFESPPANGGLGWRLVRIDGAHAAVGGEFVFGGGRSLELSFDGSANPDFAHVYQVVGVEGGRTYRLRGWWRGDAITTRSGVFVELVSDGGKRVAARSEPRYGSWEWQAFETTLRLPDDARFLTVRVRRARTDALDNLISGRVWFDELVLEPVDVSGDGRDEGRGARGEEGRSDLPVATASGRGRKPALNGRDAGRDARGEGCRSDLPVATALGRGRKPALNGRDEGRDARGEGCRSDLPIASLFVPRPSSLVPAAAARPQATHG